jgi:hypothetical protein
MKAVSVGFFVVSFECGCSLIVVFFLLFCVSELFANSARIYNSVGTVVFFFETGDGFEKKGGSSCVKLSRASLAVLIFLD